MVKDAIEQPGRILFEKWNSFSRITVDHTKMSPPALPGPSPKVETSPVEQRWIEIDGVAGTGIYRFEGDLDALWFLAHDITSIAYGVPGLKTGAVIGVGGGRDLLTAKLFGLDEVVGVELNPVITRLLKEQFREFTSLATLPGITIETDEARSWFSRTARTYDVIQISSGRYLGGHGRWRLHAFGKRALHPRSLAHVFESPSAERPIHGEPMVLERRIQRNWARP